MRFFKRTVFLLLLIAVLAASASFLFIQVYGSQIKESAISYLNQQLNTEVQTESIDVAIWKTFPMVSVNFTNVRVKESLPNSQENLALFKRVYLAFDAWQIIQGHYVIEEILLEQGKINMAVKSDYTRNFRIFKTTDKSQKSDLTLDLENITFENVEFKYQNHPQQETFKSYFEEATFSGRFKDETFTLDARANAMIEAFQLEERVYVKDKPAKLSCQFKVDKEKGVYTVKEGNLRMAGAQFKISGRIKNQEKGPKLDITIEGRKNRLRTLLALVPEAYREKFASYYGKGNFYFETRLKGVVNARKNPLVDIEFGIEDGTIRKEGVSEKLKQVNLEGSLTNGGQKGMVTTLLKIKALKATLNGREIKGSMSLNNFTDPYLNVKVKSNVKLADVEKFIPQEDLSKLNGNLFLDAAFAGRINHLQSVETVAKTNLSGDMSLRKVNVKSKSQGIHYRDLNGNFRFNGNDLQVNDFTGYVDESNFRLNGRFKNLASFLFIEGRKLTIDADFKSKHINLKPLLTTEYSKASQDSVITFALPDYLVLAMRFQCEEVNYENFHAEGVKGKVHYKNEKLRLKGLNFRTMKGNMALSGNFSSSDNGNLKANLKARGSNIAINKLFYQMDNFGQKELTNEHLKGNLNTEITLEAMWDQHLNPLYDKLDVQSRVTISEGELNNFAPIMKLSGVIDVDALKNLDFNNMENTIVIKDREVRIPEMRIKSNAFTMDFSGVHRFNNQINYHMRINLSEVLFGDKKDEDTEFGRVVHEDNGQMNLFVKMTGPANDPDINFDRKAVAQKMKKDLQKESEELEQALDKEKQTDSDKDEYQLKWDDE